MDKHVVVIVIVYDEEAGDEILDIHRDTNLGYEGVVSVVTRFGSIEEAVAPLT